ncbi:MAG: endonuclease/exonuclease/phosphatase family protein [Akkermansiaceae bacterium]|nr:endonuclease/exonuclease/phosphatase family protein [Akkermansiaceae bacterium]
MKYASTLLGAFFCLLLTACSEKKGSTENWENPGNTAATNTETGAAPAAVSTGETAQSPTTEHSREVRFLAYNLKNYLTMRRYIDGKAVYTGKPEEEIRALMDVVKLGNPDILGVCEIGSDKDLKDFQARLKTAGIDLPHTHRVEGADETRALAILSRYPIVSTAIPSKLDYTVSGVDFKISRGILDATLALPNRKVRFLGVHFKSKRPIKEADQELMRRSESLLLRQHIDEILKAAPDTQLLAYGDFNDTKRTKAVYTIRGRSNSPLRMEMLEIADSRGENWTHNWTREDIYSRFDFAMVNTNLAPHINKAGCKLLDPGFWELASDHRALLVLIK